MLAIVFWRELLVVVVILGVLVGLGLLIAWTTKRTAATPPLPDVAVRSPDLSEAEQARVDAAGQAAYAAAMDKWAAAHAKPSATSSPRRIDPLWHRPVS
jgi:hypothetical protein